MKRALAELQVIAGMFAAGVGIDVKNWRDLTLGTIFAVAMKFVAVNEAKSSTPAKSSTMAAGA